MKNWFKFKSEGNWFQRLFMKWYNWRIDRMFTCPICKKGEVVNRSGYFECTECKHEFKGERQ